MRKIGIVTVTCFLAFTLAVPCLFAQEADCGTKLKNGFINIFTSVLEVPRQVKNVTEENDDPIAGMTYGLAKGVGFTIARLIVGVFDVVTCPFPPFDEPAMDPDFEI